MREARRNVIARSRPAGYGTIPSISGLDEYAAAVRTQALAEAIAAVEGIQTVSHHELYDWVQHPAAVKADILLALRALRGSD